MNNMKTLQKAKDIYGVEFIVETDLNDIKTAFKDGDYEDFGCITFILYNKNLEKDQVGITLDFCIINGEDYSALYFMVYDEQDETLTHVSDYYTSFEFNKEMLKNNDFEGLMNNLKDNMKKALLELVVRYY